MEAVVKLSFTAKVKQNFLATNLRELIRIKNQDEEMFFNALFPIRVDSRKFAAKKGFLNLADC